VVFYLKINLTKSELVLVGNANNVDGFFFASEVSWFSLGASYKDKSIWDSVIEKIEHQLAR